jgi:hypothetical protein
MAGTAGIVRVVRTAEIARAARAARTAGIVGIARAAVRKTRIVWWCRCGSMPKVGVVLLSGGCLFRGVPLAFDAFLYACTRDII